MKKIFISSLFLSMIVAQNAGATSTLILNLTETDDSLSKTLKKHKNISTVDLGESYFCTPDGVRKALRKHVHITSLILGESSFRFDALDIALILQDCKNIKTIDCGCAKIDEFFPVNFKKKISGGTFLKKTKMPRGYSLFP